MKKSLPSATKPIAATAPRRCASQGDDSQPKWDDAPEWQKASARVGVIKHLENPAMTAADSHRSWLSQKLSDGWSYGPVKDPDNKRHPCMVPYKELPADQQMKDHIFKSVIAAAVAVFGVGSVRR